jgi:integrase
MPKVTLTARSVPALKSEGGPQTEYWDKVVPGLALRVGHGGTRTYIVRYRANGKHRRMTLGKHPNLTLAKAREKARQTLADAQGGEDPALDRQERRSADVTFKALADEVLEAKARDTRERTRKERRRLVDVELLPTWGTRPAASITRREVVQLLESIVDRGAPILANRVLEVIRLVYNEGIKRDFPTITANPAHLLDPPAEKSSRDRYLTRPELRIVWAALEWESPVVRALFRFAVLTGQRIGNCAALRWSEIDDADVWHIAASAFKGRRPHLVPLSKEALAVLEEIRVLSGGLDHVFPGRGTGRVPYFNGANKALQRVRERTEIPAWTLHDFRTTFRTHATRAEKPAHKNDPAGLGVAPPAADAVLGHKEASLGFDRYTAEPERYLLAEKRDALAKWGRFVAAAVEGEGSSDA